METSKLVDELLVTLEYQANRSPRSCFVVFSSRENHVEIVIDCIETVFQKAKKFQVLQLDKHLKSGDSQYAELTELLSSCCFAVVVLDGFRPNVLFEYGILKGLDKPCIVLLEEGATVDVHSFFPSDIQDLPPNPTVDMDRHFSDVKDRFYLRYDRNKPKQIRKILLAAYKKLEEQIENEFLYSMFPHREVVESELKAHLTAIVTVFTKNPDECDQNEIGVVDVAHAHVERLAAEHNIVLPSRYFSILAFTYANIDAVNKAVAVIDGSISKHPDDAILLLSDKARILRQAGNAEEALHALDAAIKLRPKVEFLWHNKAITLDILGQAEEAVRCYKKAIALDSGCPELHYHYGLLLYEKPDYTSALREFDKALRISPKDTEILLWKARALDSSRQPAEARNIVEDLISADPVNADAWYVLGCIEEEEAKALEHYQKAAQLNPQHGGALCSSAACLSNLGKHKEALHIFGRMHDVCFKHEECSTLISNTCTALGKIGKAEDGLEECDKILLNNPKHRGALEGKACSLARMGKFKEALRIFSDLLSESPAEADLWYNQACAYALAKKSSEAVQSLQKAVALDKTYQKTADSDPDLIAVRRTKAFRNAFGARTQKTRTAATKIAGAGRKAKGKKRSTKKSSRRPKGRG